jgi:hypothetical protein
LAHSNGRAAAGEEGVTGDQIVEKGADRLQELANRAAARGDGVGEWLSKELRDDAAFLRKLKPSLIAARARGEAPTDGSPEAPPQAAAPPELTPQPPKPKPKGKRRGPPPVAIVAAALVAGIVLAKVVDWRGHAHPRD